MRPWIALACSATLATAACATPNLKVTVKKLPDPSPITLPGESRGATVMVIFVFKFSDEATGEEKTHNFTVTGVAVEERHVLTSAVVLNELGEPAEVSVIVPEQSGSKARLVSKAVQVARSDNLLLIRTTDAMPATVTLSEGSGPELEEPVKTFDVFNGSVPGVSHAGTVSFVEQGARTPGLLLIDVPSSRSSMGAGVFNAEGHLVAVLLAPVNDGQTVNYGTVVAISVPEVRAFLRANGIAYRRSEAPK